MWFSDVNKFEKALRRTGIVARANAHLAFTMGAIVNNNSPHTQGIQILEFIRGECSENFYIHALSGYRDLDTQRYAIRLAANVMGFRQGFCGNIPHRDATLAEVVNIINNIETVNTPNSLVISDIKSFYYLIALVSARLPQYRYIYPLRNSFMVGTVSFINNYMKTTGLERARG